MPRAFAQDDGGEAVQKGCAAKCSAPGRGQDAPRSSTHSSTRSSTHSSTHSCPAAEVQEAFSRAPPRLSDLANKDMVSKAPKCSVDAATVEAGEVSGASGEGG